MSHLVAIPAKIVPLLSLILSINHYWLVYIHNLCLKPHQSCHIQGVDHAIVEASVS